MPSSSASPTTGASDPAPAAPYRAQTKGKIERPIRYLRQSFVYGRSFAGDADLQAQAEHWLATVANVRRHATTLEAPLTRFERDERGGPVAPLRAALPLASAAPAARAAAHRPHRGPRCRG